MQTGPSRRGAGKTCEFPEFSQSSPQGGQEQEISLTGVRASCGALGARRKPSGETRPPRTWRQIRATAGHPAAQRVWDPHVQGSGLPAPGPHLSSLTTSAALA